MKERHKYHKRKKRVAGESHSGISGNQAKAPLLFIHLPTCSPRYGSLRMHPRGALSEKGKVKSGYGGEMGGTQHNTFQNMGI